MKWAMCPIYRRVYKTDWLFNVTLTIKLLTHENPGVH